MSSSDIQSALIEAAAADADGVCASQTPGGAGNLTINGALASGGTVTFDEPRQVTIAGTGNEAGKTFTITGTDETGAAASEAIAGPNNSTVTTTTYFATVTQVAVDAGTAAAVTVGSSSNIAGVIFKGSLRLRGMYVVNGANSGIVTFREGSAAGDIRMQYRTSGTAASTEFPSIPDYGILHDGGAYVLFDQATMASMTVFYS